MRSCAFGPCDKSLARGGPGCCLCDYITTLQEPPLRLPERRSPSGKGKVPPASRSSLLAPKGGRQHHPLSILSDLWDDDPDP